MVEKDIVLYDSTGAPLALKRDAAPQVPEIDPGFLHSPTSLFWNSKDSTSQILQQPYKFYSWVYAAVSAITINLRRLKPYLYNVNDQAKMIINHPMLQLWKRPNPFMNGSEFMEAILLNLLLPTARTPGGQCFLLPGTDFQPNFSFFKGDIPDALYPFSDQFVYAVVQAGKLKGWELRIPENDPVFYAPDEVIRIKLFNPSNWLQGQSPYSAAAFGVETDAKAASLFGRFSDNGANIGGILSTEKSLNKEQADDLTKRWNNKYAGAINTGKTAVLHSGLKYENTARSLVDLQFIEQRKFTREEILAVYRIPKYAISLYEDINYATSLAAKATFWHETLVPYLDVVWDAVNADWIQNIDGRNLEVYSDLTNIQALKDDLTDKIKNADTLISSQGVPPEEAYRLLDIPIECGKYPWLKLPLVKGSRVNLDSGEIVGSNSLFGNASDGSDSSGDNANADKADSEKSGDKLERILVRADEREKFWVKYVEKSLNPPEKKFISVMKRYFIDQRNTMQDLVDEWAAKNKGVKVINRAFSIADLIPDKVLQDKLLKAKATPLYDMIIELQAAKMQDELGTDLVNWNENGPYVEKFKKLRTAQLLKINTNTFEKARDEINKIVNDGIDQHLTVNDIAKNIKDLEKSLFDVRINNANTIARTETASISSSTRFSIMDKEGINLHEWISARDEAVRTSHYEEDGHVCEIGEEFPVTGLLYPCYPGGDAEEVINCRCVAIAKKGA